MSGVESKQFLTLPFYKERIDVFACIVTREKQQREERRLKLDFEMLRKYAKRFRSENTRNS
jgi:hypothetical protein